MARPRLQIPQVVVFALFGSASVTALVASCGDDGQPAADAARDSMTDSGFCTRSCVPESDGEPMCPPGICVDDQGRCPTGCMPEPAKYYCIPDNTDAGVCPEPAICIVEGEMCPPGCFPVG